MTDKNKNTGEGQGQGQRVDVPALLAEVDIVRVIEAYVPLKKSGVEFEACCPFHTESTPSFKVNPKKQFYNCFGCGAHGNAITFLQEHRGLGFLDACRELGADIPDIGAPGAITPPEAVRRQSVKDKKPDPVWVPLLTAPADAPEPPKAHVKRGLPEMTWCYRDAAGGVLGYVYRFKTSDGGKETLPLSWARCEDTGVEEWHWISFAKPRPLYGLDRLAARPSATVLLVEGEKCADAPQAHLPDLVTVSWPGGCNAEGKVDWSPLAGRKVITWADCDAKREPLTKEEVEAIIDDGRLAQMPAGRERASIVKELKEKCKQALVEAQAVKPMLPEAQQPGTKVMRSIHGHLHALNARIWSVAIPAPGEKPNGWDVADAIDEGLVGEALAAWVREHSRAVPPPGAIDATVLGPESASTPSGAGASQGPPEPPTDDEDYGEFGPQGWRRLLLRRDGKLVDCRENVYMLLKYHPAWQGVLWADEFAKKIVMRKPPPWVTKGFESGTVWNENDALRLGLWLAHTERMIVKNVQNLTLAVGWAADENHCHPVREYLDGLVWDDTPRIDKWLTDYMGVKESEYSRLAGRFFLIGMVARIYRPGCQMRFMPIFEGRQYRGKSSALRILGGKWFSDTPLNLHNKDSYQVIQGVWVNEIAELDSFSRADSTLVKAFVSSQTDRFRAPYKAAPEDHGRQGVFGGSTNEGEYFKDETGNTRYWPLTCEAVEAINLAGLAGSRDQLFAEAVALFRAGERWHPTSEEQHALFEPEQAAREVVDPWYEKVAVYLGGTTVSRVTALELLTDCLKIEVGKIGRAKAESMAISKIMRRLRWKKDRETSGNRLWYYERPQDDDSVLSARAAGSSAEVPDVPF